MKSLTYASKKNQGFRVFVAGAMLLSLGGCLSGDAGPSAYFSHLSGRKAVESQLEGVALTQHKSSMRRIRRDLASYRTTLEQLQRHGKTAGIARFEDFVKPFLDRRVDPLIARENVTSHPELRPFQAELLLSKAILLDQMGEKRAVRKTIARLETDFDRVSSMLVLYPTGEAVTLEQSIALLRRQTGEI